MAKASISLRLEPHELHILKESLRLMSLMMETMIEGKESLEDYEFNPGVFASAYVMFVALEEMRTELGMEMDSPPTRKPVETSRGEPVRPEPDPGLNLLKNFKHGYRTARMAKRATSMIKL